MSIIGIASSLFSQLNSPQNNQAQPLSTEFQQLGQDLQAGNLTQAQTDFTALQQSLPAGFANNSPLAQEFSALGSDLQAGNLSASQQDFANMQQTVQQSAQLHHHHHHHGGGAAPSSTAQQADPITQMLDTLGQDLQSGDLSQAQQAYSALTQNLQPFGGDSTLSAGSLALPSSLSVSI
jgi:outer membrane protein assembly factor BamD (BamD/ComL family)